MQKADQADEDRFQEHQTQEKTHAIIVESAQATLTELFDDFEGLRRGAQQTLSISAVMLGLLLNFARLPTSQQSNEPTTHILFGATILLLASTVLSLILQFTRKFMIGQIDPEYLYHEYSTQPPIEVYRAQLSALIKSIQPAKKCIRRFSIALNITRAILVVASFLTGIAVMYSVEPQLIERLLGVFLR
jgi:fumarate reductase subunit D